MIIFVCGEENGRAAEWSRCWSNWQDINGIYYAGLPNRDCSQHKAASISRVLSLTGLVWNDPVLNCLLVGPEAPLYAADLFHWPVYTPPLCLNFCLAGLTHLTLLQLKCLHFCSRQAQNHFSWSVSFLYRIIHKPLAIQRINGVQFHPPHKWRRGGYWIFNVLLGRR